MKELPRLEVDHDENVVAAEPKVAELDEIASPYTSRFLAKESGPTLTVWRRASDPAHVPLDGSLGDGNAELEELTANALGAPHPVVGGHVADDVDDLGWKAGRGRRPLPRARPKEQPSRCQRRRVSGLRSTRVSRQRKNLWARARSKKRSRVRNWGFFDRRHAITS